MGMIYVNGSLFIPGSSRELSDILSLCAWLVFCHGLPHGLSYILPQSTAPGPRPPTLFSSCTETMDGVTEE